MRYWDTTKDRDFDIALDLLRQEQREVEHLEQIQDTINISNPMKLYGAI